jgi:hypothetical protein
MTAMDHRMSIDVGDAPFEKRRRASQVILVFFACTLALSEAYAQQPAETMNSRPSSSVGRVNIKNFVKVYIAADKLVYSLSYDYDFSTATSVYINGIGTVPAKGEFRYFTADTTLQFRDRADGNILKNIQLQETLVVAAKPPLNIIPNERDFEPGFRSFIWNPSRSLIERANAVLGNYFHYLPRVENSTTYLVTTFTPLQLQSQLQAIPAQLALLLSFPYDSRIGEYTFRVQELVQEGRPLSDEFRNTNNSTIIQAADNFVNKLIEEMRAQGS